MGKPMVGMGMDMDMDMGTAIDTYGLPMLYPTY